MAVTPTVLLLGGGYTLQHVASLLNPGRFVLTSRSTDTCSAWHKLGWHASTASLEDESSIAAIFSRFPSLTTVVDSVPPLRDGDPTRGVKTLTRVLASTSVNRIVYLSTTGVFGVRDGSIVNEETPANPWNSQGAARWESEQAYQECVKTRTNVHVTALRLPAIYGFDRGVAYSIRSGSYRLIDDGSHWTNRIHVEDLARIITACINYQGVLPSVLCVSDDEPVRACEVAQFVCAREGLAYPGSISAQDAVARGAYTMLSNQRIMNQFMKQVLGITLRYPTFREGLFAEDT